MQVGEIGPEHDDAWFRSSSAWIGLCLSRLAARPPTGAAASPGGTDRPRRGWHAIAVWPHVSGQTRGNWRPARAERAVQHHAPFVVRREKSMQGFKPLVTLGTADNHGGWRGMTASSVMPGDRPCGGKGTPAGLPSVRCHCSTGQAGGYRMVLGRVPYFRARSTPVCDARCRQFGARPLSFAVHHCCVPATSPCEL